MVQSALYPSPHWLMWTEDFHRKELIKVGDILGVIRSWGDLSCLSYLFSSATILMSKKRALTGAPYRLCDVLFRHCIADVVGALSISPFHSHFRNTHWISKCQNLNYFAWELFLCLRFCFATCVAAKSAWEWTHLPMSSAREWLIGVSV